MVENLTSEQRAEFQECFNLFDKDEDNRLNPKEVVMALKSMGVLVTENEVGAQPLDFNTFLVIVARKLMILDPEADLTRAFQCFDQEGSGFISTEYLKYILTSVGDQPLTPAQVDDLLTHIDPNRQGSVNCKESAKLMLLNQ